MPTIADLKAELLADPLGRGYASMTDAQIAASLNAANIAVKVDVPAQTVRGALYERGLWGPIVILARSLPNGTASHDNGMAAAYGVVSLADQGQSFMTSIPAVFAQVQSDLNAIVAAGALPSAAVAGILALASATVTRASQIGWPDGVDAGAVLVARGS